MTNAKGKPIYDLLRSGGIKVNGVVVLGVFAHVECHCEETARKAARVMQRGGFEFLKITKRVEEAKNPNMDKAVRGMSTWVEFWTAHLKAI